MTLPTQSIHTHRRRKREPAGGSSCLHKTLNRGVGAGGRAGGASAPQAQSRGGEALPPQSVRVPKLCKIQSMDDNCARFKVWMTIVDSGWNVWV